MAFCARKIFMVKKALLVSVHATGKKRQMYVKQNTTKKRQVRITGGRSRHERNPSSRGYQSAVSAEEKIMHASKLHKKPKPIQGFKLQQKERIQQ